MFKYYMFALTITQFKKNISKHIVYFDRYFPLRIFGFYYYENID